MELGSCSGTFAHGYECRLSCSRNFVSILDSEPVSSTITCDFGQWQVQEPDCTQGPSLSVHQVDWLSGELCFSVLFTLSSDSFLAVFVFSESFPDPFTPPTAIAPPVPEFVEARMADESADIFATFDSEIHVPNSDL